MFMCKYCQQQYEDENLAYTMILENRLQLPPESRGTYTMRFCCQKHAQNFLEQIRPQQLRYVLTKKGPNGDKQYEPAVPADLLVLIGSKAF